MYLREFNHEPNSRYVAGLWTRDLVRGLFWNAGILCMNRNINVKCAYLLGLGSALASGSMLLLPLARKLSSISTMQMSISSTLAKMHLAEFTRQK
jgi:hypothetical protein